MARVRRFDLWAKSAIAAVLRWLLLFPMNEPSFGVVQLAEITFDSGLLGAWDIGEGQTCPYLRTHSDSDINKDNITNFLYLCTVTEQ